MLTIEICFIGVLQKTMTMIGVQYSSFLTEKIENNETLIGLEIELTESSSYRGTNRLFFWTDKKSTGEKEMQILALQALQALQIIYGFSIIDFNYHKIFATKTKQNNHSYCN